MCHIEQLDQGDLKQADKRAANLLEEAGEDFEGGIISFHDNDQNKEGIVFGEERIVLVEIEKKTVC